jgi:tetratricopeptide (TPR) repeat protein
MLGRLDEAAEQYEQVLQRSPNFPTTHNNLGNVLLSQGQLDQAAMHYQKAIELKPDYERAYNNLGKLFVIQGRFEEAIQNFKYAQQISPNNPEAGARLNAAKQAVRIYQNALVFAGQNRIAEAIQALRQILQVSPASSDVCNNLAWLLSTNSDASVRDGNQAVELASRAAALTLGKNPEILDTLAAAYAEAGRYPEAIKTIRQALDQIDPATDLAKEMRSRRTLYEQERPYREGASSEQLQNQ